MQMKTFKKCLPYLIQANVTPMIVGHHGVGKSQGIAQFCADKDYHYVDLRLGTQDVGDLIGLPDHAIDKISGNKTTTFCPPDWLITLVNYCEANPKSKAIIFLDEMNRARRDVLQAIFQLVLDKKMHTVTLPKNAYVVAAMNPNTEDYIVNDIGDKALLDRFCHIKLAPTPGEWLDYAKDNKFNENIVGFISEQREMLRDKLEDFTLDYVKPSPRSWEAMSRLIEAKCPTDLLKDLGMGLVGTAATTAFISYNNNSDKPFKAKDILDNFDKFEKQIKKYSDSKNARMDLISESCRNVVDYIKKSKIKKLNAKNLKNLTKFLVLIPGDKSFDLGRELYFIDQIRDFIEESVELEEKWANARGVDPDKL